MRLPLLTIVAGVVVLGLAPSLWAQNTTKVSLPRNLPLLDGMREKELRETIHEMARRIDSLEDDLEDLRLKNKLLELESRGGAKDAATAAEEKDDAASPDSPEAAAQEAVSTDAAENKDATAAVNAEVRPTVFVVKLNNIIQTPTRDIEQRLMMERNQTSGINASLTNAKRRLQEMSASRVYKGWDRNGKERYENTYADSEVSAQRRSVERLERDRQMNLQRIKSLERDLEQARTTTTLLGVTEDGVPLKVTTRNDLSVMAQTLQVGKSYRVDGTQTRTNPTREVLARSIVPVVLESDAQPAPRGDNETP